LNNISYENDSRIQKRTYAALGEKNDASWVSARLLSADAQIRYVCSVAVDSRHWDIAHACGLSRTLIKKLRGRQAFEARGADDERIDTEGALAEVLAALLLEKAGALIAPLVAHKPDSGGVDITLADIKIDVKSIGQGRQFVNINCQQHVTKAPGTYMLVHFTRADVADVYAVSAQGVGAWKPVTFFRGAPLDPRRYYFSARLPASALEPLPEETEA